MSRQCQLLLSYFNTTSKEWLDYVIFSPFHEGYFDGVCIPMPGDIIKSKFNKEYKVIRREFIPFNDGNSSSESYIKTVVMLEEVKPKEELASL